MLQRAERGNIDVCPRKPSTATRQPWFHADSFAARRDRTCAARDGRECGRSSPVQPTGRYEPGRGGTTNSDYLREHPETRGFV